MRTTTQAVHPETTLDSPEVVRPPQTAKELTKSDEKADNADGSVPWGYTEDDTERMKQQAAELLEKSTAVVKERRDSRKAVSGGSFREATGFYRNGDLRIYLKEAPEDTTSWDYKCWQVACFMETAPVKGCLVFLIVANAVLIGVEADYGDDSAIWGVLEMIFLVCFTLELVMNLIGYGRLFFTDGWNLLDFFVVVFSLIDFFMTFVGAGDGAGGGLSVVRLVRIVRVIRVISFLEKLVYLVAAFVKGMASAFWVFILMILAMYIFAVLGKSFFGDSNALIAKVLENSDGDVDVKVLFGTIPDSFLTLVQFFTFDDALGVQKEIAKVYPLAWLYFFAFLIFVAIGMMELLASLFIDSLLEEKHALEQKKALEKTEQSDEITRLITGLFTTFDADGNGALTTEELEQVITFLEQPATKGLLDSVGVELELMKETIRVSDINGDGSVTQDELERALESIHIPPTKADMRDLAQRTVRTDMLVKTSVEQLTEHMDGKIDAVSTQVYAINGRLDRMEELMKGLIRSVGQDPQAVVNSVMKERRKRPMDLPEIQSSIGDMQDLREPLSPKSTEIETSGRRRDSVDKVAPTARGTEQEVSTALSTLDPLEKARRNSRTETRDREIDDVTDVDRELDFLNR